MKIVRTLLLVLFVLLLGVGGFVLVRGYLVLEKTPNLPMVFSDFRMTTALADSGGFVLPPMPDISGMTVDGIQAKVPARADGQVRIVLMKDELGFDKFSEDRRQLEFSRLQGRTDPIAIVVQSGVYDLPGLLAAVNDPALLEQKDGIYTLSVPLYVANGASLVIRGLQTAPLQLHLAANTGAFLLNGGQLFIIDSKVDGWDVPRNAPALHVEHGHEFHPFITTWSGSETYLGRSSFYDLGYGASKSYGISYSTSTAFMKANPGIAPPKGWLVNCRFERLHYGFYSYEAEDVAIIGNVYADNQIYGIDPHDRSRRLIIYGNEAYGSHKRHGIIVSREVTDSWIVGNVSHDNTGSGIMLDRSSARNIVSGNRAYNNGGDGITLFESQDNILTDNRLYRNKRNGILVRNSWNVWTRGNSIILNQGVGIQLATQDIKQSELERDFVEDPFTQRADINVSDSNVLLNEGGGFKFINVDFATLRNIEFGIYDRSLVRGNLSRMAPSLAIALRRLPQGIRIERLPLAQ